MLLNRTVLILGAGPGGLQAAERLRALLPDDDRIVIVDRRDEQYLGVSFLGVMRGWHSADEITIHPSILREREIYFIQSEIEQIDAEERRVHLQHSATPLGYDALIVALGAELAPGQIPGLSEAISSNNGGEYYSRDGASRLNRLLTTFDGGRVAIVVARLPYKCPPAPYEGALLIDDLLRERGRRGRSSVDVFTPEPSPIAAGGPVVGDAIRELLAEHDITLHISATLNAVDSTARSLSFDGGQRAGYDLLVAIPPHVPPSVVRNSPLGGQGWIEINRHTMRSEVDGVWAIGDVTLLRLLNGMPMPKAAVFAVGQAEAAARDIARSFGYDAPEPDFDGRGRCWFATGNRQAGYVEGAFLHEPSPRVALHPATSANFDALLDDERHWIDHWRE
jgi:sulfide:quinone oxidoreductase